MFLSLKNFTMTDAAERCCSLRSLRRVARLRPTCPRAVPARRQHAADVAGSGDRRTLGWPFAMDRRDAWNRALRR
jgi:hypothetical protein